MMQRSLIFLLTPGLLALCLLAPSDAAAAPAAARPAHYAITAEQVAAAVTSQGVQVSPEQVTLLTDIAASVAAPALSVKSIERGGAQRAIARIECSDSQQCLPFVVSLHVNLAGDAPSALLSSQQNSQVFTRAKASPILVRAGSPAKLLLDGAHVHISLTVICLQNGAMGQTVRATDRDRHQIYTATVAEDGVLEGSL